MWCGKGQAQGIATYLSSNRYPIHDHADVEVPQSVLRHQDVPSLLQQTQSIPDCQMGIVNVHHIGHHSDSIHGDPCLHLSNFQTLPPIIWLPVVTRQVLPNWNADKARNEETRHWFKHDHWWFHNKWAKQKFLNCKIRSAAHQQTTMTATVRAQQTQSYLSTFHIAVLPFLQRGFITERVLTLWCWIMMANHSAIIQYADTFISSTCNVIRWSESIISKHIPRYTTQLRRSTWHRMESWWL